jgi:four helix bundle protein
MVVYYKDLIAWQKAMDLVAAVYELTESFPRREMYSLCDQIRRAAVSIPSNIAEGQAHYHSREFLQYLRIARGSLAELETQLLIADRQKYVAKDDLKFVLELRDEVSRILSGLINSVSKSIA